ncbi:MAG: hypothetical protein IPH60_16845 [Flavobacteriales bacterium]|nr:hypothetical protein [Flavobacteriales bacterium]
MSPNLQQHKHNANYGVPPPGCGNYQGGDVWFRFVAPPSGRVFIDSHAGTMTDGAMALYSAMPCPAIGPLTLVACNDDDGEGLMPQIDRMCNPLTPGQTYTYASSATATSAEPSTSAW